MLPKARSGGGDKIIFIKNVLRVETQNNIIEK